jgi:iron(III) transport system permease protein
LALGSIPAGNAIASFAGFFGRVSLLGVLAGLAGLVAALPLVGVALAALSGDTADIAPGDVLRYAATSAWLAVLVGLLTALWGSLAAWLVVMHRFPGRDIFAWALALPLAVPAFALAYAYADLFDVAGPLRIAMRATLGFDLPIIVRGIGGAAFILSCAFYPYVYLAMRAAFLNQSLNVLEAARMLGRDGWQAFRQVALPLARPSLAAGVALAVMETLADYGAVQFLSVQTLTTGVVRAWSVYGSTASAARFALPLLGAAALLLWFERQGRRGRSHEGGKARWRPLAARPLHGAGAWAAFCFCLSLLIAGLLLPVGWLLWSALDVSPDWPRLLRAGGNSLTMGMIGAVVTVTLASVLALGARRLPMATRLASLGYATPGAVMAIGLLAPAGLIWSLMPGSGTGIALALLIYAYAARLMAAALEPIDAGLSRVTPSMVNAARSLGRSEAGAAVAVQLPVARGAMLTAGLVVFIDILKELPATLILRPFDFDTLAVIANNYALDERLGQAGPPSVIIVLLSLPAVIWLTREIAVSRPGA